LQEIQGDESLGLRRTPSIGWTVARTVWGSQAVRFHPFLVAGATVFTLCSI